MHLHIYNINIFHAYQHSLNIFIYIFIYKTIFIYDSNHINHLYIVYLVSYIFTVLMNIQYIFLYYAHSKNIVHTYFYQVSI